MFCMGLGCLFFGDVNGAGFESEVGENLPARGPGAFKNLAQIAAGDAQLVR